MNPPYDKSQLIIPTQNNLNKKGNFKDKFTFNPNCEEYNQYEFLGMLMGICIRTGVFLSLNLCSFMWKRIIGDEITIEDYNQFDESLINMITLLKNKNTSEEEINTIFNDMQNIYLSDNSEVKISGKYDLKKYEDRINLSHEIIKTRYDECNKQINSIKKGLNKMLPLSVLKFLTYEEFENLICGRKIIDLSLLKKNTIITPEFSNKEYLITWLWEILEKFSDKEKKDFIKFCYAQESLPSTQDEYSSRQIAFTIKYNAQSKKDLLPHADTCFFFLILPDYSSKDIMEKMIKIAISFDNVGMNGDVIKDVPGSDFSSRPRNNYDYEIDDNY